jgi:hypothetical protein
LEQNQTIEGPSANVEESDDYFEAGNFISEDESGSESDSKYDSEDETKNRSESINSHNVPARKRSKIEYVHTQTFESIEKFAEWIQSVADIFLKSTTEYLRSPSVFNCASKSFLTTNVTFFKLYAEKIMLSQYLQTVDAVFLDLKSMWMNICSKICNSCRISVP